MFENDKHLGFIRCLIKIVCYRFNWMQLVWIFW